MSGSAVAGVSHDQSGRLPAISLRRQSVPGVPAAAAMHAQPEYGEGRDPTRVAGSERPGGCSSSGAARQEDLRTQERNGGTQLRRCQTAARASLRTHARLEERAPAVPAGSNGAEHQENRPPAEPSGTESATGATPISAAPASGLRNPVAGTQQPSNREIPRSLQKNQPHQKSGGVRQQSEPAKRATANSPALQRCVREKLPSAVGICVVDAGLLASLLSLKSIYTFLPSEQSCLRSRPI